MTQQGETTIRNGVVRLSRVEMGLQALTVVMLVATIVAVQANVQWHLAILAAPVLSIVLWACSGLLIDRQTLRAVR